jgi:DNA-binding NarL/FixJ family response regulator/Tfp pilus assembly protein PilF
MTAMGSKQAGWELFGRAEWAAARDAFGAALADDPGDPDALDGLGQSLWWLGERDAAIDRRREAYAAYQARGNSRKAGGLAIYLAGEHRIDGQHAAGAGWLSRAQRLLAGEETVPELGWLAIEEAKRAEDPKPAEHRAQAALDVAHELGDPDIECMALAQLGRAVVRQGRVEEGVVLLDEAMTVALGGETRDPLACGDACCTTLVVCDGLADLERAAQWCEAVVEFTERRRFLPVQSWCRSIYGGVLLRAGEWARAEAVLVEALRRTTDRRRGAGRALPLAVLADLRLRQGRSEEAERLLAGLEDEPSALGPMVKLHIERGDVGTAQALLDRRAEAADEDGEALVLRGALALEAGDLDAAAEKADRLRESAERLARQDLAGEAAFLGGRIAARRGDNSAAARALDEAAASFAAVRYPLEEARARLALARVQAALQSPLALRCAKSARDALERLGARADADQAAALLRELGASGRTTTRGDRAELTSREREVLSLVAAGLSNVEIADRLVIAPKTAEHHVGRVLSKLGVRSRAEAAAHAVRQGL